jgi:hypothetical protein
MQMQPDQFTVDPFPLRREAMTSKNQRIEPLNAEDTERVARQLIHAEVLVAEAVGSPLSGELSDLRLLQKVLDSKLVEPEATYSLQALGMAFGKVFVSYNHDYAWWMVEDAFGRDPALRYKETTLLVFPLSIISKRVENGDRFAVPSLYEQVIAQAESMRAEHFADA